MWVWVLVSSLLLLLLLWLPWLALTWLSSLLLSLLLHACNHGSPLLLGLLLNTLHDGLDGDAFLGRLLSDFGVELCFGLDVEGLDLLHLLGRRLLAGLDLHAWGQWDAHRHAWARHWHAARRRRGCHRGTICGVEVLGEKVWGDWSRVSRREIKKITDLAKAVVVEKGNRNAAVG